MGYRGDIATATKALASRGHCCQRRGWGREWLARHVGALAPVCQQRDDLLGVAWGR